ncbi:UNKNOWN [Stylonychia lemnae]|uniref:Choline transporter-like protein n=1 Tax=Stylonychia lemnae TaxID=5949 RepID=A0A077ZX10_STYLE|nr:UNKNOWN [Stylonychia lemnae]|eukprot:CDW74451.1 UNKNOWN [Stylonychia lemnae]
MGNRAGSSSYVEKDIQTANDEKNKTPPELQNGVVTDRQCTDVFMCIIFTVFFCGMFATAAYGYAKGDPVKLITPFDSDGNQCGLKGSAMADYKVLYWPNLNNLVLNPNGLDQTVCVKYCPDKGNLTQCVPNTQFSSCPEADYESKRYIGRYCLPTNSTLKDSIIDKFASGNLARYFGDLGAAWYLFLIMAGISTTLCLIYLILLKWIAKPMIYISLVLIFLLLLGGGFYVFYLGVKYEGKDHTRAVMIGMGIMLWIMCGLFLLAICCCWGAIRLAAAIMQAASDFVRNTPQIFFVPAIFFFIISSWIVFWIISAIWVFSVGTIEKRDGSPFAEMKWETTTRYVWIYHLFGLLWISAFIIACAQFIIAAVAALWYFSQGGSSDDKGKANLRMGIKWIFRYHVGSIAFGSLLIAIMQMIKLIFEYLRRKTRNLQAQSCIARCMCCIIGCFIQYLDSCVRFIAKNAYIQMALTSKNFCTSARLAFSLVVRNAGRFSMTNSIGGILIFLGRLLIAALSAWIAYIIIMNSDLKDEVYSPVFPIIVVVIIATPRKSQRIPRNKRQAACKQNQSSRQSFFIILRSKSNSQD